MSPSQEQLNTAATANRYAQQAQTSSCGQAQIKPIRTDLLHRLHKQEEHSVQEVEKAMAAAELIRLLEIHPDVARILDLMDQLRP